MRKPAITLAAALTAIVSVLSPGLVIARAAQVEDLARTIETDRSEKARIAAVVALGNLADPRGVPALIRALSDPSPIVRGVAASALGHIGDPRAVHALERALGDDNDSVRNRAREALASLRESDTPADPVITKSRVAPREAPRRKGAKAVVVVKDMAAKARASRELTTHMKEVVVKEIAQTPELTLDSSAGDPQAKQFIVDGSITRLSRDANGPWIEITCEVKLTVSNAQGSILSMVSGGATVQTAKGQFRKEMEPGLQVEALENAIRGAHQNLLGFLVKQIAVK